VLILLLKTNSPPLGFCPNAKHSAARYQQCGPSEEIERLVADAHKLH